MYRCRVEKRIYSAPAAFTRLCYELDLAQAPELGRELSDGRWFSGPLIFVVWNVDEACFNCRVQDESPVSDVVYDYSHDWLVQNYLHEGWRQCPELGDDVP